MGAQAIECTMISSRPHRASMQVNTAVSSLGLATLRGSKIGASNDLASGSTWGRALSLR